MNARIPLSGVKRTKKEKEKKAKPIHFRTIWISDIQLGTSGCQAKRLL